MTPEQEQVFQRYQKVCGLCTSPEANEAAVAKAKRAAMEQAHPWLKAAAQANAQAQPQGPWGNARAGGAHIETVLGWLNTLAREGTAAQANGASRMTGRSLVQPRLVPVADGFQLVVDVPMATLRFIEQQTGPDRTAVILGMQDRVLAALNQVVGTE